jgi:3-oxoacyl-(acyl-carrier-protein) synthase
VEVLARVAGAGHARGPAGPGGATAAVEAAVLGALADAGVDAGAVDLVVASASGGPLDREEALGLERALLAGAPRSPIPVVCPKAALGEAFGFTSAAQALVAVKALAEGTVPPTPGSAPPDLLPRGFILPRRPFAADIRGALAVAVNARGAAVAVLFRKGP